MTVGGSLNTAEKLVWLKCFKQWMSGDKLDGDDELITTVMMIMMAMTVGEVSTPQRSLCGSNASDSGYLGENSMMMVIMMVAMMMN